MAATVWANSSDYSSTASGFARTNQIDLTSLGSTNAREGDTVDMGANMAESYLCYVALEYATAPSSRTPFGLYFHKQSGTGKMLPSGLTGSDSDYTGTSGSSIEQSVKQFYRVPLSVLTEDATTVVQYVSSTYLSAATLGRYVTPILHNTGGQALVGDAVEMFIALVPYKRTTTTS